MKTSTKLTYASILACMMSGTMSAKDLYIAANGNDSNTGISADAPRATLTGLNSIIEEGDVIHVSGMIDMTKEKELTDGITDKAQTWGHWFESADKKQNGFYINGSNSPAGSPWKNITIEGENPENDGFDGKDATRLFYVRGDNNKMTVTFRNLSFLNGLAPAEGAGAIFIHDNGFVTVDNCIFDNNHLDYTVLTEEEHDSGNIILKNPNSERGGAINMQFGHLDITDSKFINNKNRRGGALCITGGKLNVARTLFEGNGAEYEGKYIDNTRGGAVVLWPLNTELSANFDHCDFIDNTVWNMAGALYLYSNTDGSNLLDVVCTNCSFIGNSSINGQAGAVMLSNAENYGAKDDKLKNVYATFANSSFFYNKCKSEGGAFYMLGALKNDELRFVNCTMALNQTAGNAGHGAGYVEGVQSSTYTPEDAERYFYNCIFEQNYAPAASDGKGEYSDFLMYPYFDVDHTYVGRYMFTKMTETDFDDMLALNGRDRETVWHGEMNGNLDETEFDLVLSEDAINGYEYSGGKFKFITLDADNEYLTKGNPEYLKMDERTVTAANGKEFKLQGYDISESDQMGFKRPEGTCAIGSMEIATEDIDPYFDEEFPYISGNTEEPGEPGLNGVNDVVSNTLAVSFANGVVKAQGAISVYDITGALVATGVDVLDLNNLSNGAYIVKAVGNGAKSTVKVIK